MTAAALVAAVVLYLSLSLPPATQHLGSGPSTAIYGAYHIHTQRSDGSGSLDDVAAAAAKAGLQFVIVTDHGNATRAPEPSAYRHGVLVIDAVEISTISGHLVALGLRGPSPFPLGGEARDTVEDVHRMGGWTVAAHPDSPHTKLRWNGDDGPPDAFEWLNADSEWRDESLGRLLLALGHYAFRPSESIASIFNQSAVSLDRWDALSGKRTVIGLAAVDAHARIGIDEEQSSIESRTILARPSYEDMFRTVAQGVVMTAPLTGDAARDAAAILGTMRAGRTYSVVRAFAEPGQVEFSARSAGRIAGMGEELDGDGDVTVSASVPGPDGANVVLFRDGRQIAAAQGSVRHTHEGQPATYRAEVHLAGAAVPWIVTNAIRVGPRAPEAPVIPAAPPLVMRRLDDAAAWIAEKHATSRADLRPDGPAMAMAFRLAPGRLNGQYAAMAYALDGPYDFRNITATLRASVPMRVSVQVRQPGGDDGERWQRSVYVDETPRAVTLALQDFNASGAVSSAKPIPLNVRAVMFVVDTWHTSPGTSGTIWVSGVSIGGPAAPAGVRSER